MSLTDGWTAWVTTLTLIVVGGFAGATAASADTAPASPSEPLTVASDVLPTVQIDGVVGQVIVGHTVYAVGEFTFARPAGSLAGSGTVARSNMLAYDLFTGALANGFAPAFVGMARS